MRDEAPGHDHAVYNTAAVQTQKHKVLEHDEKLVGQVFLLRSFCGVSGVERAAEARASNSPSTRGRGEAPRGTPAAPSRPPYSYLSLFLHQKAKAKEPIRVLLQ